MKDRTKEIKYLLYLKGQVIKNTKKEMKILSNELKGLEKVKVKK